MTDVHEAEQLIRTRMPQALLQRVALEDSVGRVLAESVFPERDQPPFDRVMMDGIAVAYRDWVGGTRRFQVVGTQGAGAAPLALDAPAQCIAVMTGAMMPTGADAVVPVERIQRRDTYAEVHADASVEQGRFIHPRGSDHAGDEPVLAVGTSVGPTEMAVLAGVGAATVPVSALPRIAVISTGDELVDVGEPIKAWQIRSGNDRAMAASIVGHGLGSVQRVHLADDQNELIEGISALHEEHEVLILSGGVSMGQFDYVPAALHAIGAERVFHKVEQRPGRPMWFGMTRQGKPVFALPGNPVSALVCLTRYVLPALRQSLGLPPAREYVELAADVELKADLSYFVPVTLRSSDRAVLEAAPRQINTSGDFISLAGTAGIVELPRGRASYQAGAIAELFRW